MSRTTSGLLAAIDFAVAPLSVAFAQDRAPTAEERTQIEQVLKAEGFTSWEEIELDDGVWEVDDAIGADGQKQDLKLDQAFAITEREPD
ncbi:PepSY domain-containing protein [Paracoccus yeei]|uniref:PepSY domain-containing protein n=1 Tax=Paracoccus yeei TaxID=147645 RepID=UPI001C8EB9A4|nr:PepSY domain-containing protein [Paracoccus yeei]MBY0135069.1 PepSY domain-containing protein [Paracoccus yeei]